MFAPAPCTPDGRAPRLLRVSPRPAVPAAMPPAAPIPDSGMLAAAHRLAELYQLVFPQKQKWRKKRLRWQEEKLVADIQTFGNRVNRHHFPLYCDLLDADLDTGDWWLWQMPLELHGFCAEHHGEWDSYDEPIPLLLKLSEWEYADEDDQAGLTAYCGYDYDWPPGFCLHQLDGVLDRMDLPPPLDALPDLVRMVLSATGNPWLDYSIEYMMECDCYPEWEDYEYWRDEWQLAVPILARIERLTTWVQATGLAGLDQIVAILLAAHQQLTTEQTD
jgi:hypothetical protein